MPNAVSEPAAAQAGRRFPVSFTLEATDRATMARAGVLHTRRGDIPTPVFMPVGTQGTVKATDPRELWRLGARIVLNNTYHLMLRPGSELVDRIGGAHRFMGWPGAILTDSGGFQAFSLAHLNTISDDGVTFASHLDGQPVTLTPELAVAIQEQLGSDIAMVLDQPAPYPVEGTALREALERTHRWAERCLRAHRREDQAQFGIVQGGIDLALRAQSARTLASLDFPGYAVGGLSVGEPKLDAHRTLEVVTPLLPAGRPRYLMGVGSPEDLVEGVARGIDMFDCALPTRVARNGGLYTRTGRLNIRNARFAERRGPIEEGCDCPACRRFSTAYLRTLFFAEEPLAFRLATLHNLRFLLRLMEEARAAICDGGFASWSRDFLAGYQPAANSEAAREHTPRRRGLPVPEAGAATSESER
ncbi:MAG: tRNA guanosine(34) transglycosylase Tgt [Chloroflexi bacterium]|nr:tRNA guanosine(34) transglycosylase Tgt [Chloroflexota bacterium]